MKFFLFFIFFILTTDLKANTIEPSINSLNYSYQINQTLSEMKKKEIYLRKSYQTFKDKIKINGKNKKIIVMDDYSGAQNVSNMCIPFFAQHVTSESLKSYDLKTSLLTQYSVNICIPCPKGIKPIDKKSNLCVIPLIEYVVFYKNFFDLKISKKSAIKKYELNPGVIDLVDYFINGFNSDEIFEISTGREISKDINKKIAYTADEIITEVLVLPLSLKEKGFFFNIKINGDLTWFLYRQASKTAAHLQPVSRSFHAPSENEYIENYIAAIQKKFYSLLWKNLYLERDEISSLHELIPETNEFALFLDYINTLEEIDPTKQFFQTRN